MSISRDDVAYVTLGLGFGGLADGFILHQVLQWHHLISSRTTDATLSGLRDNTLADGVFNLGALAVLGVGLGLLLHRRIDGRRMMGLGLVGWGGFNIADHLVLHVAMGLHHIRDGVTNYQVYDWTFFGLGVLLVFMGMTTAGGRSGPRGPLPDPPAKA